MDTRRHWGRRLVIIAIVFAAGALLYRPDASAPTALASEQMGIPLSLVVAGDDTDRFGTPRTGFLSQFDIAVSPPELQAIGIGAKRSYDGDGGTIYTDVDAKDNIVVAAALDAGWQLFEILEGGEIQLRSTSQGGPRTDGGFAEATSIILVRGSGSDLYAYVGWSEDPQPGVADGMSNGGIDVYRVTPQSVTRVHRISDLGVVGAFALSDQRLLAGASHCGGFAGWCQQTLYVLDVSSPNAPRIIGEGAITENPTAFGSPLSIAIGGTFAIIADGEDVHLVNIGRMNSDPSHFVTRETPGEAMAVGVADDRFYIADGSNGFIAGSISALLTEEDYVFLQSESTPAGTMLSPDIDVAIDDVLDRAYVANGTERIKVYDVSQRTPRWLETFNTDGYAHALQTFQYTPASEPEPISVNTYLRDLPEGAQVRNGDRVWFCFSVSRPVHIKWLWYHPVSGWHIEAEYDDDGHGDCRLSDPMEGVGVRRIRIEAHEDGQLLASHETFFYVVDEPGTPSGVSTYPAEYPSTDRLPDGAQVPANEKMYVCFTLDRDTNVEFRVIYEGCPANSTCSLIYLGPYEAPGLCREYTPRLPGGLREMRLRTFDANGTLATAESSFYVYDPSIPEPTTPPTAVPPTPVIPPTPIPPTPVPPTPTPKRDSYVLFIHGWQGLYKQGYSCDGDGYRDGVLGNEFGKLTQSLMDAGYRVFFLHYDSNRSRTAGISESASCVHRQSERIRRENPELEAQNRIILAHSMGGLVARNMISLKRYSGDRLITFGSPHHGVYPDVIRKVVDLLHLPVLDCSRDPGTCQLSNNWVNDVFNEQNPVNVPLNAVGGTGAVPLLSSLIPGADDGVIALGSSLGSELHGSRRAWEVRDTHFGGSIAKPYNSGGDSRACLEEILGIEGLTEGDLWPRCRSASLMLNARGDIAAPSGHSSVNQAEDEWVHGLSVRGQVGADSVEELELPVEGDGLKVVLSWQGGDLDVLWHLPDGTELTSDELSQRFPSTATETSDIDGTNLLVTNVPSPTSGKWKLMLREQSGLPTQYYAATQHQSNVEFHVDVPDLVREGDYFTLSAEITDGSDRLRAVEVWATWTLFGDDHEVELTEGGTVGKYHLRMQAPVNVPGIAVSVHARGISDEGHAYRRTSDQLVSVASPDILPPRVERLYLPILWSSTPGFGSARATPGIGGCMSGEETEPNDLIAQGMLVCEGAEVSASLSPSDEADYFIIEVPEERLVDITIWDYAPSNEPSVSLHRLDGTTISIELMRDPGLTRLARRLFPGKYALRIGHEAGSAGGTYRLVWNLR